MDNQKKKKKSNIINKGPIYREPKTLNWKKSKEGIVEGLGNLNKEKLLSGKKIPDESQKDS